MSNKFSVEIGITARADSGGSDMPKSEGIRERSTTKAAARSAASQQKEPGGRGGTMMGSFRDMGKHLIALVKTNQMTLRTMQSMEKLSKLSTQKMDQVRAAFDKIKNSRFGQMAGSVGSAAKTVGMGGIGAAIPFAGAVLGAANWLFDKTMEVGHAYRETTGAQFGTAGVGGFQYGQGNYHASEMGQYMQSMRMASGSFTSGSTTPWSDGSRQTALNYSQIFGQDLGTTGRQVGLMEQVSGKSGEQQFAAVFAKAVSSGFGTQIPALVDQLSGQMEQAITDGVNNSSMATDMAQQVGALVGDKRYGTAQSALAINRNIASVQQGVHRGDVTNLAGHRMRSAALEMIQNDPEIRKQLAEEGYLSSAEGPIDPAMMETAAQHLQATQSGRIQNKMLTDVYNLAGQAPGDDAQKFSRFHQTMQNLMPELQFSPEQAMQTFQSIKSGRLAGMQSGPPGETSENFQQTRLALMGRSAEQRGADVRRESVLLATGGPAADALDKMQTVMQDLAIKSAPLAQKAFAGVAATIEKMGTVIDAVMPKAIDLINKVSEKLGDGPIITTNN